MSSALSIVVTHYRTPQLLHDCLTRLEVYAPDATVTVVDNSSGDNFLEVTRAFSRVKVIEAPNHSMADAVNRGLKAAKTPFILQMNADLMLGASTLPSLLEALQHPSVGMVGPRCRTPAGKWQDQGLFYRSYYALLDFTDRASVTVPWLSGCCQMVKREVVERLGGMDSSLRFYNEDIEWCWRVRRGGYRCELIKESVLHVGGASTPPDPRFIVEGLRGGYVLSQRFKSPLYRTLHRYAVQGYIALRARFTSQDAERQAYRDTATMFAARHFDESPFGETLTTTNPHFLETAESINYKSQP